MLHNQPALFAPRNSEKADCGVPLPTVILDRFLALTTLNAGSVKFQKTGGVQLLC